VAVVFPLHPLQVFGFQLLLLPLAEGRSEEPPDHLPRPLPGGLDGLLLLAVTLLLLLVRGEQIGPHGPQQGFLDGLADGKWLFGHGE
jgi:hypothetical protein